MEKMSVAQQLAQKKIGVFPETYKITYITKPKQVKKQFFITTKLEVLEENDYAGVRTINSYYRVTEKGSRSVVKKDSKLL